MHPYIFTALFLWILVLVKHTATIRHVQKVTTSNEYPFMVSLYDRRNRTIHKFCGGSIISPSLILTSIYCINYDIQGELLVNAGVNTPFGRDSQRIRVEYIHTHPCYEKGDLTYGIGLLELEEDLIFDETVDSIELPTMKYVAEDVGYGDVLGWASISKQTTQILLRRHVEVLSFAECETYYPDNWNSLCVRPEERFEGCSGDPGGSLIQQGDGADILVGISTDGSTVCNSDISLYLNTQYALDFIQSVKGNNQPYCEVE